MNQSSPSPDLPAAWLEFPSGERVPISGLCSIGRKPGSQVIIHNERVSRRHAVIRRVGDGSYEIMDMGSSNGTYVDGQRLGRPTTLAHGQVIEIGLLKMTFRRSVPEDLNQASAITTSDCWLLVVEAAMRGAPTPSDAFAHKTVESWNERCLRVIHKYQGTPVRALQEGLVAYWRAEASESLPTTVTSALLSLRAVQKDTEEFRFAVHFGPVIFRGEGGSAKPSGDAMIFALQLQRLVSAVDTLVLISAAASLRLAPSLPMRRLTILEMRLQGGEGEFFTLRDP